MSFYMMYQKYYSKSANSIKIGYMSTTNVKNIMTRYVTGCGNNVTVYQFLDSNPKHMETEFKKHFKEHVVNNEFYKLSDFFDYMEWCMDYTKSAPVVGYSKYKCVSKLESQQPQSPPPPPIDEPVIQWRETDEGKYPFQNTFKDNFTKTDDKKWKCVQCEKIMSTNAKRHHFEVACRKGLTILQCKYCEKVCAHRFVKSKHQKICKKNPLNMPVPPPQPKFGRENVDYLLNDEVDPRYENVKCSVKDCLDLAHFNKDHPENQTVRKLNKKSDLMEFQSESGWEPEICATGIPRMLNNLETKLKTKFEDKLSNSALRELLYHNTKRGALGETVILARYKDIESQ